MLTTTSNMTQKIKTHLLIYTGIVLGTLAYILGEFTNTWIVALAIMTALFLIARKLES